MYIPLVKIGANKVPDIVKIRKNEVSRAQLIFYIDIITLGQRSVIQHDLHSIQGIIKSEREREGNVLEERSGRNGRGRHKIFQPMQMPFQYYALLQRLSSRPSPLCDLEAFVLPNTSFKKMCNLVQNSFRC